MFIEDIEVNTTINKLLLVVPLVRCKIVIEIITMHEKWEVVIGK